MARHGLAESSLTVSSFQNIRFMAIAVKPDLAYRVSESAKVGDKLEFVPAVRSMYYPKCLGKFFSFFNSR